MAKIAKKTSATQKAKADIQKNIQDAWGLTMAKPAAKKAQAKPAKKTPTKAVTKAPAKAKVPTKAVTKVKAPVVTKAPAKKAATKAVAKVAPKKAPAKTAKPTKVTKAVPLPSSASSKMTLARHAKGMTSVKRTLNAMGSKVAAVPWPSNHVLLIEGSTVAEVNQALRDVGMQAIVSKRNKRIFVAFIPAGLMDDA